MRMIRTWRSGFVAAVIAIVGCGSAEPMQPNPTPEPPQNPDNPSNYTLAIVGWQNIAVAPGEQVALQAKYTKDGVGVADATINFRIVGDLRDNSLLRGSAQTNAAGVTETIVRAGQTVGQIRVEALAAYVAPVEWLIDIRSKTPAAPAVARLAGVLTLTSSFDVETPFAGTKVGEALNALNDISDDPDDPGNFVVGKVLERIDNPAVAVVAGFFRPALNAEVNKLLTSISPTFVSGMKQLARDISTVARRFQVTSLLSSAQPQPSNQPMTVDHALTRIGWELGGRRAEYSFAQLGLGEPRATGVVITPAHASPGHEIASHELTLRYGAFLVVAINELVIPNIDQNAHSMGQLLNNFVRCDEVGKTMNRTAGVGGDVLWAAACTSAMNLLAGYVESRIVAIDDEESRLNLAGQAIFLDNNQDAHFDVVNGTWSGTFSLGSAAAPIDPAKNTFTGLRTK